VCVGAVLPRGAHAKLTHKSVFSVVNSAISMALRAFAAERRAAAPLILGARCLPLSIDISGPHGDQQQTRHTPLLRSNDGTDGRRDGRTDALPLVDPAPHTMRAVPVIRCPSVCLSVCHKSVYYRNGRTDLCRCGAGVAQRGVVTYHNTTHKMASDGKQRPCFPYTTAARFTAVLRRCQSYD